MESLEKKQEYLRNNILEKGYDADEFMSYLQDKKTEDGIDLNLWTFSELKDIVKVFIHEHKPNEYEHENQIIENNQQKNISHSIKIGELNNHEIFGNNNYYIKYIYNNDKEKVFCKKNDKTDITKLHKIKINFGFPLVVNGGFFSKSYVTYELNTIPFNSKVRRRYTDFEWLKIIMSNLYPNTVVPPIPKKNFAMRFNEEFISKRTRSLGKFVNGIAIHPLLKNNQIFYDFLTVKDEDDFNYKKNEYNKIKSPQYINDYKTQSGEVDISLSIEKENTLDKIKESCLSYQINLSNIMKAYKELISSINNINEQMKNISNMWSEMRKISELYNEKQNTIDAYYSLSNLMNSWCEIEKRQALILNVQLREFYRYIKNEYHSLEELVYKVENTKYNFYKENNNLMNKKNSLFEDGDTSYWELEEKNDVMNNLELLKNKELAFSKMLPEETKKVLGYRNFYAFYLNSVIDEYNRIKDLNGERNKKIIRNFCKETINNFSSFNSDLIEIIENQFELNENDNKNESDEEEDIKNEYNEILKKEKESQNEIQKPENIY